MADSKQDEIQKAKEAAQPAQETTKGGDGGLEDDDVWGDVDDPMKELDGMTDD